MAMDYEWSIMMHEKELQHLRELQALTRAHSDAHDKSIAVIGSRMERIEANLDRASEILDRLTDKFDGLIELLAREHSNGKKGQ
jgi:hypothetical protein